ncbi:MAG: hypothetical protein GY811_23395 [Myxococcales bacterium]|nr:hypothetical protein [Myxococcales bacterium]
MTIELTEHLISFADRVGGFAAAGRKLDIPADTLRRAATGERVRRGTVALIAGELARLDAGPSKGSI